MTFFAVFLFFSFAVMALTLLVARGERRLREVRAAAAIFWGVGLAWLANLNLWTGWHVGGLRYGWVGVTLTGLATAGTALVLRAATGALAGLHRKLDDQAETIERTDLRRIA
ncbi:MAG: hypothetical protein JWM85_2379, partial [Acidimicrobiaceae bacterium]|nr:hypothetical protein [Acidimicrobiaceae bacterium]